MKILSRRNGPAQNRDVNGDGLVDDRDRVATTPTEDTAVQPTASAADRPVVAGRDGDGATYRSATAGPTDAERRAADRAATARAATGRPPVGDQVRGTDPARDRTVDLDRTPVDPERTPVEPVNPDRTLDRDRAVERPVVRDDVDRPVEPVAVGPKPRASLLATLGLIVSVVGALFVLTGTLAGYGVGLGAVGAILAVLGLMATRRRHVAGKTDALIGILVGLAAVVLGIVALTGQFDWPTTDGDWVGRFREWLDSQFAGMF